MKSHAGPQAQTPQVKTPIQKLLISREDAAVMLSMSERTLDYLISDGRLKCRRVGARVYLHIDVLKAFAEGEDTTPKA